jgi:hypothetical protein
MSHIREVRIALSRKGMRIIGTGRWADPGDYWMLAHDLMHHHPQDHGTVEQELQTFGAQLWLEVGTASKSPSFDESQISMLWLECSLDVAYKLRLQKAKGADRMNLPRANRAYLRKMVQLALSEAGDELHGKKTAEYKRFTDEEHVQAILSWMALGYLRAKERYPRRQAAQELFEHLKKWFWALGSHKHPGSRPLKFLLDEKALTVTPLDRAGRCAMDEVLGLA